MVQANKLAGRSIRHNEPLWKPYENLIKSVSDILTPDPVVPLGVCKPAQLASWHIRQWIVLDCHDRERTARLQHEETQEDICETAQYRALDLRMVDETTLTSQETAQAFASNIHVQ